jgi:hypothetical protein
MCKGRDKAASYLDRDFLRDIPVGGLEKQMLRLDYNILLTGDILVERGDVRLNAVMTTLRVCTIIRATNTRNPRPLALCARSDEPHSILLLSALTSCRSYTKAGSIGVTPTVT